ncbi:MAG: threonylcarbamoyl-AMP synthase [Candidatus Thorarchaeota archaeon]|nr:threonylcarbamoyl-AMP synthase [Candidatus Thorarchaeota archaeon]
MNAEIMRIEDIEKSDYVIERAAEVISAGGVVVYPTDTSYGLGCDPRNRESLERLIAVKRRDRRLGFPLLFADESQCEIYHDFHDLERVITRIFWPGALTIIVEARPDVLPHITAGRKTIAIRVPDHVIPRGIAKIIGGPIVGTSANHSGGPSPFSLPVALEQLGDEVDLYIDGGPSSAHQNSTIIGVEGPETESAPLNIKIYREGALPISQIEEDLKVDSDAMRFWSARIIDADM